MKRETKKRGHIDREDIRGRYKQREDMQTETKKERAYKETQRNREHIDRDKERGDIRERQLEDIYTRTKKERIGNLLQIFKGRFKNDEYLKERSQR